VHASVLLAMFEELYDIEDRGKQLPPADRLALRRVVEARGLLQAHRGLAECLSIMGRPAEAIAECERLAALDTEDHAAARFMHLDLLITSREFAAARRLLAAALAVNPHVPRVLLSGREVDPDGMVTVGDEDEAELHVRDFRRCRLA
jgi:tetratricopeptide (TPR) repeat protein